MFAENPVTAVYTIPRTSEEERDPRFYTLNISGKDFIVNWKASQKAYMELKDEWNPKVQATITIQRIFRGISARDMIKNVPIIYSVWCYFFSTESYKLRQQQIKLLQLKPTQQILSNELIEEG